MKQAPPESVGLREAPFRLCFLSYRHLSELAAPLFDEFTGRARIEGVEASFQPAVSAACALEQAGAVDAFVSAGSNAVLLREAATAPVATIQVNGHDLLVALMEARRHGGPVGVVTFGGKIAELERVKALLNIDVVQRAYRTPDEARECLSTFAAEAPQVIVGSGIAAEMAQQQGMQGVLVYSKASVRQGIADAIELARIARLEVARKEQVHALLHNHREAVLAVDAEHRVTTLNSATLRLLGAPLAALQGRDLRDVAPGLSRARSRAWATSRRWRWATCTAAWRSCRAGSMPVRCWRACRRCRAPIPGRARCASWKTSATASRRSSPGTTRWSRPIWTCSPSTAPNWRRPWPWRRLKQHQQLG